MVYNYKNFTDETKGSDLKSLKAKVVQVDAKNEKALVETLDDNSKFWLINKTSEILNINDYVTVSYNRILSSASGYIAMRNGLPKFTAYHIVLTQAQYDALKTAGKIIDTVLYIIIDTEST